MSVADELEKLSQLYANGTLTQSEFEQAKSRLLGTPSGAAFPNGQGIPFRRSMSDLWLGGVCGGLGAFTGIEAWIWRLVFVLGLFAGGFSLLAYFLLWIFVPRGV